MNRTANSSVNYQALALEFHVGDEVYPYPGDRAHGGRVTEVFPAIGMVEVSTPAGSVRVPVEELMRTDGDDPVPPQVSNTPGGTGTVPVAGGPGVPVKSSRFASVERVARAWVKQALAKNALYWAEADRKYRATQDEKGGKAYYCPKCKDICLKPAVYRRENGASMRLLGCPTCLFLIERDAVIGHHANESVPDVKVAGLVDFRSPRSVWDAMEQKIERLAPGVPDPSVFENGGVRHVEYRFGRHGRVSFLLEYAPQGTEITVNHRKYVVDDQRGLDDATRVAAGVLRGVLAEIGVDESEMAGNR